MNTLSILQSFAEAGVDMEGPASFNNQMYARRFHARLCLSLV